MNRFNRLLLGGTAPEAALREAFGDMTPYYSGMRNYVQRSLFSYVRTPVSLDSRPEGFAIRPLSAGEAAVMRGHCLVAMNRPAEARAFAAEAAKADAALPGPWEIEAELSDDEGRRDEAKAAFAKAAQAGSARAYVYYRLAQLEWVKGADRARLERLVTTLEKARGLEPESADTLSFLAGIRSDLGQHDEAVALAEKAVETEPAESYHRLSLARALWGSQRPDEALKMAQSALHTADDEAERRQAQGFLDFAARAPRPRPAPSTPEVLSLPGAGQAPDPATSAARPSVRTEFGPSASIAACFEKRDDPACAQAAPALEAACEAGQAVACRSLGSLYDGGFGIKQDKARAAAAYDRGCRGGDKVSCARFAVLQSRGDGVARDSTQALSTLQRLCKENVDDACIGWALVLAALPGSAERAKARELLRAPCDRGNDEACRILKSLPR